jgi:hypothetical protein
VTEGIEYNPTGTVDVTLDDETYHLGRPKLKQWRYFTRQMEKVSTKTQEDLAALVKQVGDAQQAIVDDAENVLRGTYELADEKAKADDATRAHVQAREVAWTHLYDAAPEEQRQAYDEAQAAVSKFAETPFYLRSSGLLLELFELLGDPLPSDIDEWPAWLATDVKIPGTILAHWRTNPKASGSNGTG